MLTSLYGLAVLASQVAVAQDVEADPTSSGLPGGQAVQTLLNWLAQGGLWASLAAILAGGGMYGWARFGQGGHGMAVTGARLAGGGAAGALLVGLGPTIVNSLYRIT
ncbi:MAG TPA: hypothetical protein VE575_11405 [Acidimicrobiales bacterium]|nr:hypothetical protein [Acidimicrobiales bacterium]